MGEKLKLSDKQLAIARALGMNSQVSAVNLDIERKVLAVLKTEGATCKAGELARECFGIKVNQPDYEDRMKQARQALREATLAMVEDIASNKRKGQLVAVRIVKGMYKLVNCPDSETAEAILAVYRIRATE